MLSDAETSRPPALAHEMTEESPPPHGEQGGERAWALLCAPGERCRRWATSFDRPRPQALAQA
jgi:hypothetical protein